MVGAARFKRKGVNSDVVAANNAGLAIAEMEDAGANTSLLRRGIGKARGEIIGALIEIGQPIQVVLGSEKIDISLQDLQGSVLTKIPKIAAYIERTQAKELTLRFPVMVDEAHWGYRPVLFAVEELADKKLLQTLAENVAMQGRRERTSAPLGAIAGETVGVWERFKQMEATEKGWVALNAAFMAMFLHGAWQSFHDGVATGEDGKRHVHWGPMTLGCVNTLAGGLLAHQLTQQFCKTPHLI